MRRRFRFRRLQRTLWVLALIALIALISLPAWGQPPTRYRQVAEAVGIPAQLLYAIAQTESNTRLAFGVYPWPWTLNVKGKAMRFETRELACQAVQKAIAEHGEHAVDIGLTQQNWGYVGRTRFSHPCDALEPTRNLLSAALLLRQYHQQSGNWLSAAALYHRPAGGVAAEVYRRKVQLRLEGAGESDAEISSLGPKGI